MQKNSFCNKTIFVSVFSDLRVCNLRCIFLWALCLRHQLSVILLYLFNVCLVLMFFFVLYFDDLNLFVCFKLFRSVIICWLNNHLYSSYHFNIKYFNVGWIYLYIFDKSGHIMVPCGVPSATHIRHESMI
jgi:hypothetical protein